MAFYKDKYRGLTGYCEKIRVGFSFHWCFRIFLKLTLSCRACAEHTQDFRFKPLHLKKKTEEKRPFYDDVLQ